MTKSELIVALRKAAAELEGWRDIEYAYTPVGKAWCGTRPDGQEGIWGNHRGFLPTYWDESSHADRMRLLRLVEAAGDKAIKRYNLTFQELALWLKHPEGTNWERAKFSHWTTPGWAILLCAVEALGKLEGITILDAAKLLKAADGDTTH